MAWEQFDKDFEADVDFTRRLIHRCIDEAAFRLFDPIYTELNGLEIKYRTDVRPPESIRVNDHFITAGWYYFLKNFPGIVKVSGGDGSPLFVFSCTINNVFYKAEVKHDLVIILRNNLPIVCFAHIEEIEDNVFELTIRP